MGHNWKVIVDNYFPGRTALQARNQYNQVCRRTGFDTQPSTPGSMQGPISPLPMKRSLSHISPAPNKSIRPPLQRFPTDTDLEYEESDDNPSSEDSHDDDANWPESEKCSQWDPASVCMQASQSPSHRYALSPHDFESLTSPLPNDGMRPLSSFDQIYSDQYGFELENALALQQATNEIVAGGQVWKVSTMYKFNMTDTR